MDKRIHHLCQYITEHLEEKLTIENLAEQTALSKTHFSALFKTETGVSPMRWIDRLRLEKCAKILKRDDFSAVKQIAYSVGFRDQNRFIREFKKKYGHTSGQYRRLKWQEYFAEAEKRPPPSD